MLNLTRRPKQGQDRIVINPGTKDQIVIQLNGIDHGRRLASIGIEAPRGVAISREEILNREEA